MNILISAYACEPGKGSEPEVGWRWVLEMSKLHSVTVLTRSNNRPVIEEFLQSREGLCMNVTFVYTDLAQPILDLKGKSNALNWYYLCWQYSARKIIERIVAEEAIDLVHLVTFASFRYPVFLRNLSVPVIWGPVGGGELAPWSLLFYRIKFPQCVKEIVRNLATEVSALSLKRIEPTRSTGGVAIASTPRTQKILMKRGILSELMPTIGVDPCEENYLPPPPIEQGGSIRFLFVGRLVLLKGVHLLLEAMALAKIPGARLTVVGDGELRAWLEALTKKWGLQSVVLFVGHVPKDELPAYYQDHDVLVAPSLYESGGYMALEAFQQQRPVITFDIGGLALSVDASCGVKVPLSNSKGMIQGLAEAMQFYSLNPQEVLAHGLAGQRKCIIEYGWETKRMRMNAIYEKAFGENK